MPCRIQNNMPFEEFGWLARRQKINGWLRGQGLQRFALTPRT